MSTICTYEKKIPDFYCVHTRFIYGNARHGNVMRSHYLSNATSSKWREEKIISFSLVFIFISCRSSKKKKQTKDEDRQRCQSNLLKCTEKNAFSIFIVHWIVYWASNYHRNLFNGTANEIASIKWMRLAIECVHYFQISKNHITKQKGSRFELLIEWFRTRERARSNSRI